MTLLYCCIHFESSNGKPRAALLSIMDLHPVDESPENSNVASHPVPALPCKNLSAAQVAWPNTRIATGSKLDQNCMDSFKKNIKRPMRFTLRLYSLITTWKRTSTSMGTTATLLLYISEDVPKRQVAISISRHYRGTPSFT